MRPNIGPAGAGPVATALTAIPSSKDERICLNDRMIKAGAGYKALVWGSMVRLESSVAPRILTLLYQRVGCLYGTSDVTGFQTGKRF